MEAKGNPVSAGGFVGRRAEVPAVVVVVLALALAYFSAVT